MVLLVAPWAVIVWNPVRPSAIVEPSQSMKNQVYSSYMSFLIEIWMYMRVRKKFWLLPILVMMVVFGGLVAYSQGSAVAPVIYAIF